MLFVWQMQFEEVEVIHRAMNEHLQFVEVGNLGRDQPIQGIELVRPGVDFALILQEMGLNVMGLKNHGHRLRKPNDLSAQMARKGQCIDVVDMNQGHRLPVDEIDGIFRQQCRVRGKHNPVERGTPECAFYPSRILCGVKPSYVD